MLVLGVSVRFLFFFFVLCYERHNIKIWPLDINVHEGQARSRLILSGIFVLIWVESVRSSIGMETKVYIDILYHIKTNLLSSRSM